LQGHIKAIVGERIAKLRKKTEFGPRSWPVAPQSVYCFPLSPDKMPFGIVTVAPGFVIAWIAAEAHGIIAFAALSADPVCLYTTIMHWQVGIASCAA
jgi:hypothetical protein